MKNYLTEPLTEDEKAFIYGIIKKTSLKFIREFTKIQKNEILLLDNENAPEEILTDTSNTDLVDKILETKILRDISDLKPYSQYEKEKIVDTLERIALDAGLKNFITPLTFNEKLVVFLLYIENYQVNEVSILLDISRVAVWKRDKSIKNKINIVKENLKNG